MKIENLLLSTKQPQETKKCMDVYMYVYVCLHFCQFLINFFIFLYVLLVGGSFIFYSNMSENDTIKWHIDSCVFTHPS